MTKVKDKNSAVKLMGFGHRVYKNYDPRAKLMQETCREVLRELGLHNDPLFKLAMALEKVALEDDYFVERSSTRTWTSTPESCSARSASRSPMFNRHLRARPHRGWIAQWNEMICRIRSRRSAARAQLYRRVKRDVVPIVSAPSVPTPTRTEDSRRSRALMKGFPKPPPRSTRATRRTWRSCTRTYLRGSRPRWMTSGAWVRRAGRPPGSEGRRPHAGDRRRRPSRARAAPAAPRRGGFGDRSPARRQAAPRCGGSSARTARRGSDYSAARSPQRMEHTNRPRARAPSPTSLTTPTWTSSSRCGRRQPQGAPKLRDIVARRSKTYCGTNRPRVHDISRTEDRALVRERQVRGHALDGRTGNEHEEAHPPGAHHRPAGAPERYLDAPHVGRSDSGRGRGEHDTDPRHRDRGGWSRGREEP